MGDDDPNNFIELVIELLSPLGMVFDIISKKAIDDDDDDDFHDENFEFERCAKNIADIVRSRKESLRAVDIQPQHGRR